jgi:hypothetical protein
MPCDRRGTRLLRALDADFTKAGDWARVVLLTLTQPIATGRVASDRLAGWIVVLEERLEDG